MEIDAPTHPLLVRYKRGKSGRTNATILAAIKDAQVKAANKAQSEMGKITEAMGLPKDMKLPF